MNHRTLSQSCYYKERLSLNIYFKITLLLTLFSITYMNVMVSLVRTWIDRPSYSHGFLIPFISLYIVYCSRHKLRQLTIRPNLWGGTVLTVIACLMLLVGKVGGIVILQRISILLAIPGILLMNLGNDYLRKLMFPLVYLVFMVPVLDVFFVRLHWPSQILTAKLATGILNYFNITAIRDTQFLHLPNVSIEVARACSGVHYLISILALAIPLAYLTQKHFWQKALLIILGILIVIPINSIRVALIGTYLHNGGEILHGPNHILHGLFVFQVGFVLLLLFAYILNKLPSRYAQLASEDKDNFITDKFLNTRHFNRSWFITVLILLSTCAYLLFYEPVPVKIDPLYLKLPDSIGNWSVEATSSKQKHFSIDEVDTEIMRSYKDPSGRQLNVYIGYFESQRQDKELVNYRMDWLYEDAQDIEIPHFENSINIKKTILGNGEKRSIALYWYNLNGRIVADNIFVKIFTAIDGLTKSQTNGAIIMVSTDLDTDDDIDNILRYEKEFVRELLTALPQKSA